MYLDYYDIEIIVNDMVLDEALARAIMRRVKQVQDDHIDAFARDESEKSYSNTGRKHDRNIKSNMFYNQREL